MVIEGRYSLLTGADMRRLKYMAVNHAIKKKDGFQILPGYHVCGARMLFCTVCCRSFCSACDFMIAKIPQCCTLAIDAYVADNDRKSAKREVIKKAMAKRPERKGKYKYKIKVEEICCDNSL